MMLLCMLAALLPYESLRISGSGTNHMVHFANRQGSFWVGETGRQTRHFLMGFLSNRETVFSDYDVAAGGVPLVRSGARFEYEPHVFRRRYAQATEEVFMPDTLEALVISLTARQAGSFRFTFYLNSTPKAGPEAGGSPMVRVIETGGKWTRFIAFAGSSGFSSAVLSGNDLVLEAPPEAGTGANGEARVAVAAAATRNDAIRQALLALSNRKALMNAKASRLASLVAAAGFDSGAPDLARALSWALISFDALNADERRTGLGPGIYAGYPWFQDYWGRDSFIALRALTVTGQSEAARANLLSFLKFQILNDTAASYGKVPNRVRPDESIYNTADATPRFLIEAWRYVQWTGDESFAAGIKPNVVAAVRGSLKYRVDADGLLLHNDADTWMDAVGPKGPYSPRGNRANDIQALWIDALNSARNLLRVRTPDAETAAVIAEIDRILPRAIASFSRLFIAKNPNPGEAWIADAIRADGRPDASIRPNQLWAADLLTGPRRLSVLEQTTATLGTPFGLMSVAPDHPWFHPFHKYEPVYEQDASYHNGIIWLWNTGEWLSQLVRHQQTSTAATVFESYRDLILKGVALGTLPELIDAAPRRKGVSDRFPDDASFNGISRFDQMNIRNEAGLDPLRFPAASGTFSQAWSLSEYLRNAIEDFGGIQPLPGGDLLIAPSVPAAWKYWQSSTRFRGWRVQVRSENNGKSRTVQLRLEPSPGASRSAFFIHLAGMPGALRIAAPPKTPVDAELIFDSSGYTLVVNGAPVKAAPEALPALLNRDAAARPVPLADLSELDHGRMQYHGQTNQR